MCGRRWRTLERRLGTEHILLGLLREGEGIASAVIEGRGLKLDEVRDRLEAILKKGTSEQTGPDLPYTSRSKKVLEFAMHEARNLGHEYVGTEHLLLGLLREEKGLQPRSSTNWASRSTKPAPKH